ncbi:MAG: coiled-coil domain-containing protein, partial [bacterium]
MDVKKKIEIGGEKMEAGQLIQTIAEKVKEIITAEVRQELRDFKNTVSGQLEGFKLAIESISERQSNVESEVRNINQKIETMFMQLSNRIDETNKRIDEANKRIDETNNKIEKMFMQLNNRIDEVNK